MGTGFLLDTNIAIYFLDAKLPENGRAYVHAALDSDTAGLSVISKMEILGWNFASSEEEQKARQFVDDLIVFTLSDAIVEKTIEIRKQHPKTKLPDAIIAATALDYSLTLLSRNEDDFAKISGLKIVNPMEM